MTLKELTAMHAALHDVASSIDKFELYRLAHTAVELHDDATNAIGKLAEARDIIESIHDRLDVCDGCKAGLLDVAESIISAIDDLKQ